MPTLTWKILVISAGQCNGFEASHSHYLLDVSANLNNVKENSPNGAVLCLAVQLRRFLCIGILNWIQYYALVIARLKASSMAL